MLIMTMYQGPWEPALGGRGACVPSHNLAITVPSPGLCTCWEDVNEGAHKVGSNRQEREREWFREREEEDEEGEKGREKGGEKKSRKQEEEGKIFFSRWKNSAEIGFNLYWLSHRTFHNAHKNQILYSKILVRGVLVTSGLLWKAVP